MARMRTVTAALPTEMGKLEGLAYSLWLPENATSGIVIVHGAGSCKESHHDFARAARGAEIAAVAFDLRGHGESDGPMDGGVLDDIASMTALLRSKLGDPTAPIALRGSSLGGYLAILAAPIVAAGAVVAICPASAQGLRRALEAGALRFDADTDTVSAFLEAHDLYAAVESLAIPLLLMHAEGDEQIPVQHSRELAERAHARGSRLIALPGGHHRSIQHDDELQAVSLRFIERALGSGLMPAEDGAERLARPGH